jgi:hypothetical protein
MRAVLLMFFGEVWKKFNGKKLNESEGRLF